MLVCKICGKVTNENELRYVTEAHGERHLNHTCSCGGELTSATKCKVCGEWYDDSELHGVCEKCLGEYETVGEALAIGEQRKTQVAVNEFIAFALTEEQIGKILTKWVEENFTDHSKAVVDYCEDDKYWYSEYLAEKYG